MKKVIITGASGMIGQLVLEHCLSSNSITEVVSLVRRPTEYNNPKLKEVVVNDFTDYSEIADDFKNGDVAFFCIGVYTGQVSNAEFKAITVDYAVKFAEMLKQHSPQAKHRKFTN